MSLDELMEILACPKCKGDLELKKEQDAIFCHNCRLKYSIIDGIPDMLIEDAHRF
ncbi:MAG: Trm112 family protein [Candidatus Aenigmarchaeota archaeon]|nr:Trm112 family protein [Candidatus Aenigmarchaeota archaeon]